MPKLDCKTDPNFERNYDLPDAEFDGLPVPGYVAGADVER